MAYLDYINSPQDVKKLNVSELEALAAEIRQAILNRDSKIGGHVGPNLGIVEATIALHYVLILQKTSWCLTFHTSLIRIKC